MRLLACALLAVLGYHPLAAQTAPPAGGLTIEALSAQPAWWPRQVVTKVPVTVNVVSNGQPAGSVTLPAGQLLKLISMSGPNVNLDFNGSPFTIPAVQTDVLAGAAQMKLQKDRNPALAPVTFSLPTPLQPPVAATARPPGSGPHSLAGRLDRALVRVQNNSVAPVQAGETGLSDKKYVALYFSAAWCGPCRQFTPSLVAHYNRRRDKRALYELVFVSSDRSPQEMSGYMKAEQMPWLAVDFGQTGVIEGLKREYGGKGIPCLVVIDSTGKVLSHSYEGAKYVGPQKVLKDLDRLLDQG